jgi:hypothetical protein
VNEVDTLNLRIVKVLDIFLCPRAQSESSTRLLQDEGFVLVAVKLDEMVASASVLCYEAVFGSAVEVLCYVFWVVVESCWVFCLSYGRDGTIGKGILGEKCGADSARCLASPAVRAEQRF